jgi:DNA-binding transcriptional ArsR family regulator
MAWATCWLRKPVANPQINHDRLFHALGDPTRRAILGRLSQAPSSVSRLAENQGISVTAIAQHMLILEASGLAKSEKTGRVRICQIDPAGFAALQQWIADHRTLWQRRLDRLGDLMADIDGD